MAPRVMIVKTVPADKESQNMRWIMRIVVFSLITAVSVWSADDKKAQDSSGTWKLNIEKSDFGAMPGRNPS